ncbi:RNA polymerase sigma factor [Paenibacillus ginsengarvi]|uniref:RNA polymerase sigma factor n=2 Tax=Paenibacillus ginsengarvi TaxID=400777 RepID=A0A3B0BPK2_9BACL|nr:RNA polymerase sigma factor [Paenibacillus ginsengarvi]
MGLMNTGLLQTDSNSKEEQDALLMEVYKQMFIVTYSIIRNKSEAMDAVQESWVKILRKLDTLRERDKLIQWAKVIATNTAYNMIKRKVAVSLGDPEETGITLVAPEGVEERVMRNIIFEEMNKLDEKTKQILTYKYYYDMKDKDIAERMDLPIGTVKARIHRGKEQLRAMLSDPYLRPD